jgi:hypothetical protein
MRTSRNPLTSMPVCEPRASSSVSYKITLAFAAPLPFQIFHAPAQNRKVIRPMKSNYWFQGTPRS